MGAVYEGVHEQTQERVAVKLISATVADEMKFRRRFAAEVETLKRLRHKNIVRLIGYGEEAGHLFYSMELVEGESLQQRISRLKRLDWLPTIDIAIQVCGALKHAHDLGVIHRDLKPANLLLTADGTVKLVDFGIAKLFGSIDQTVAGSVLGTADYMAPEQAESGPITPRTDLYALGSVMYAMLTGRAPFSGKRLTAVIESLKQDRPVPLDLINPELPEEIVSLVHDLLEKAPEERPPTALAVLKRLKATRAGLERGQTLNMDSSQTVLARNADPDREVTADRPAEDAGGEGTNVSGNDATNGGGAAIDASEPDSSRERTPVASNQGLPHRASPDDATIVSDKTHQTSNGEGDEFDVATPPRSHYQAVNSSDAPGGLLGSESSQQPTGWLQVLSVIGMIAILAGGIAVIAYAFKSPSADQLYEQVASAERSGELSSAEPLVRQFLSEYPDDPRTGQVESIGDTISLERSVRRLQAQANRAGGIEQLDPIEQAFLDAMDARAEQPAQARRQLNAWLNVYAPGGAAEGPEAKRMAAMVEQELAKLHDATTVPGPDRRVEQLLQRIQWGREHLTATEQKQMLRGILELFDEQPWAQPVLEQVRAELNAIQQESTSD